MREKKRNQLAKTICDKKGVTSMKLATEMNADRFSVGNNREVPPDVIFGLYELTLRLWKKWRELSRKVYS